ncbi:MAG: tetratricopeptide repeat protein [Bacteroidota bacterium]
MNSKRIELLENFVKEEPKNPFNKYALAMEFYEYDPPKSLDILQTLLKEHPNYLPSYFKTAHLFWEMEDLEKAKNVFVKGLSLAEEQDDQKALSELKSAYQNLLLELD